MDQTVLGLSPPVVVAVILNTNRREDTIACLQSLDEATYPRLQVMVLDNASTDGSIEAIRKRFPHVRVVALKQNLGYAGNNNVGITLALEQGAEWVFVLNEDTVLAPDCVARLVAAGQAVPGIGIIGPMVYHADEPRVIQSAGGKMDRFWRATHVGKDEVDTGQYPAECSVDWITGCALMIRRKAIEQAGVLDERFFYYWEEIEWCLRVKRAGWRIQHVPEARVWHKGVQRHYSPSPLVVYYSTRNRLLMLTKHRAPIYAHVCAWAQIIRPMLSWSLLPRWKNQRAHLRALRRGLLDYVLGRWGAVKL